MSLSLVVLAAGMGSRYGGLKQCDPVGPSGETIMDYSVYDAVQAGFNRVIFVIRRDFEEEFRKTIGSRYENAVKVEYAFQSLNDLPRGYDVPEGRVKPWGTAHALRSARDLIDGPFAAINADDFYGRDSFVKLAAFLASADADSADFALVGFRLDHTLSENGSVARGVCSVDDTGKLLSVTEMTKIVPVPGGARDISDPDNPVYYTGEERVSMNFWGFSMAFMRELNAEFPAFLDQNIDNLKSEWYIPFVVDKMIRQKRARVSVLPTESSWFGVTYREDKPDVMKAVGELVAGGVYPAQLWNAGFRSGR
ncbi:MAG: sugar phosphate nucleotidyltransferase [Kiritimatiellia bacterium]